MDFSANFTERAKAVLKEVLQLKKYKAMPKFLAVLVGIFMLPLIVGSFVCAGLVFISGYLYSVISLPVQSLHKLLKDEGKEVKHGTQVVIYFLSWGLVFGAYALLSLLLISLTILYTVFAFLSYLWTLGGLKFHAFAAEQDLSVQVEGKYKTWVPVVFVAVMAALLVLVPAVKTVIFFVENDYIKLTAKALWEVFKVRMHDTDRLRLLVSALYSAFVFAPLPKKAEK